MKQSTCGAVICQPGGDELKHDRIILLYYSQESSSASQSLGLKTQTASSIGTFQVQIQLQPQPVG